MREWLDGDIWLVSSKPTWPTARALSLRVFASSLSFCFFSFLFFSFFWRIDFCSQRNEALARMNQVRLGNISVFVFSPPPSHRSQQQQQRPSTDIYTVLHLLVSIWSNNNLSLRVGKERARGLDKTGRAKLGRGGDVLSSQRQHVCQIASTTSSYSITRRSIRLLTTPSHLCMYQYPLTRRERKSSSPPINFVHRRNQSNPKDPKDARRSPSLVDPSRRSFLSGHLFIFKRARHWQNTCELEKLENSPLASPVFFGAFVHQQGCWTRWETMRVPFAFLILSCRSIYFLTAEKIKDGMNERKKEREREKQPKKINRFKTNTPVDLVISPRAFVLFGHHTKRRLLFYNETGNQHSANALKQSRSYPL